MEGLLGWRRVLGWALLGRITDVRRLRATLGRAPIVVLTVAVATSALLGGCSADFSEDQQNQAQTLHSPSQDETPPTAEDRLDWFLNQYRRPVDGKIAFHRWVQNPEHRNEVKAVLGSFRETNLQGWSTEQQLAFYLNAYHWMMIDLVLSHYTKTYCDPLEVPKRDCFLARKRSVLNISGVNTLDKNYWTIAGERLSLVTLQEDKLKKFGNPLIHLMLNNGTTGAPAIPASAFRANGVRQQIQDLAKEFFNSGRDVQIDIDRTYRPPRGFIRVSATIEKYRNDFLTPIGKYQNLKFLVADFVDSKKFEKQQILQMSLDFASYDWELNGTHQSRSPPNSSIQPEPVLLAIAYDQWDRLLQEFVHEGNIDYRAFFESSSHRSWLRYKVTEPIRSYTFERLKSPAQKAYLLNAYNTTLVNLVVKSFEKTDPTWWCKRVGVFCKRKFRSIKNIKVLNEIPVFDRFQWTFAGQYLLTLNQLEDNWIRPWKDPRMLIALHRAAVSSPVLLGESFRARSLERQLDQQAKFFVNHPRYVQIDSTSKTIRVSGFLEPYVEAFDPKNSSFEGIAGFVDDYRESHPEVSRRELMQYRIEFLPIDWKLNQGERIQF